jgi:3-hydroxyisobutyrate dehydrogenase-like beta-hydroxyacid dehydrogenase
VAKICNNYIATVTGAVLADAIRIASRAGIDLDIMREALSSGAANSAVLQRNWNLLAKEAVKPGTTVVRHSPRILYKDLKLAMALAQKLGLLVPIAGVASQLDLTRWIPASPKQQ